MQSPEAFFAPTRQGVPMAYPKYAPNPTFGFQRVNNGGVLLSPNRSPPRQRFCFFSSNYKLTEGAPGSAVPQFEFLSFASCTSAMASCSLSARRRSEFGETFSVIAMLRLRPSILPLRKLSLNPIRGILMPLISSGNSFLVGAALLRSVSGTCQQCEFFHRRDLIRGAGSHSWRNSERLMDAAILRD